ncbi:MAG: TraR/DksA C4-type zinc finger protein [Chloroflexi bacterium]|nr:TraR/DksA C4-type zinc finger protein [Chloroflexota bacterium]MBU1747989.1 TraR/DksA C4-type zinc finger protein [Chloroflexota bacterium]MBU1878853.1 TraR/DksA C4-type zinc finger protein [Chloroflexota bacterium]
MNSDDRERLELELAEAQAELLKLQKRLRDKADYGLGEGDPAIVQWEINLALLQKTQDKVQQLKEALENLQAGTYGVCARCGQRIQEERLTIVPQAKRCAACARVVQASRR